MRRADNLAQKLEEVNAEKNLAKSTPAAAMVEGWVSEAATLPPRITH